MATTEAEGRVQVRLTALFGLPTTTPAENSGGRGFRGAVATRCARRGAHPVGVGRGGECAAGGRSSRYVCRRQGLRESHVERFRGGLIQLRSVTEARAVAEEQAVGRVNGHRREFISRRSGAHRQSIGVVIEGLVGIRAQAIAAVADVHSVVEAIGILRSDRAERIAAAVHHGGDAGVAVGNENIIGAAGNFAHRDGAARGAIPRGHVIHEDAADVERGRIDGENRGVPGRARRKCSRDRT